MKDIRYIVLVDDLPGEFLCCLSSLFLLASLSSKRKLEIIEALI